MGKRGWAPLRHCQCRNFVVSFSPGRAFPDTPRACRKLPCSEFRGEGVAPLWELHRIQPVLMAVFIQKLTSHPIKHHPEPEGQVLMSLCLELNCWHFMRAVSP